MRIKFFMLSVLASLAAANLHDGDAVVHKRHAQHPVPVLLRREEPEEQPKNSSLVRRDDYAGVKMTYYDAGLGACGTTNSDSDYIVALASNLYESADYCYQYITITYDGVTESAQIVDECPGCEDDGLDLTPSLFEAFADTSVGTIIATWGFAGSGGSSATSTYVAATTTSSVYTPTTSSSVWTPTTSSSIYTPTTSSTWSTTSSSSSSSSSTYIPSTTSSSSSSSSSASSTGSSSGSSSKAASSSSVSGTSGSAASSASASVSVGSGSGSATASGAVASASSSGSDDMLEEFNLLFVQLAGMAYAGADADA